MGWRWGARWPNVFGYGEKIYDEMFPHDDGGLGGDEDSNNEDDFEDISNDDDISV